MGIAEGCASQRLPGDSLGAFGTGRNLCCTEVWGCWQQSPRQGVRSISVCREAEPPQQATAASFGDIKQGVPEQPGC